MFTVCSKCNLRLTVTAADLRAAQGYVRCGHCHNVFNSLAALADDPVGPAEQVTAADTQLRPILTLPEPPASEAASEATSDAASASTVTDSTPAVAAPAAEPVVTEPELVEPVAGESTAAESVAAEPAAAARPADASAQGASTENTSAPDTSMEFNPASTSINEVFIEADPQDRTGTFESIVLIGEGSDTPDTFPEQQPGAEPQDVDATSVDEAEFMGAWAIATAGEAAPEAVPEAAPDPALLISESAISRSSRWAMRGSAVALALCLIGQAVHHYRDTLADTALLHRPLTAIYQAIGLPLQPRWDIANYEIRQLGAIVDGAAVDNLVVRASISNHATRDQPLPLLRVVMQDRFGNRVAARDLQPAEYLARGAPRLTLMAPGQRVDAQVAFQDPGQAATGFEIDACMAGHSRSVTCTNDPGSH